MVRKDSGIQTVADLKGKVVAVNGLGSGVHMALTAMLQKHGLQDKRDYIVIEAPFPTMKAVLAERKADLIVAGTPFAFDPELVAIGRTLFAQRDAMGPRSCRSGRCARAFIAKHRAVMVDLLEDKLRAVRWYLDPANRQEAIGLIASFMKQPPARFEGWVFGKNDFFRNPDGLVDLDALQSNIKLMRQIGVIKADLEVAPYADMSLVKEAAARLK